MGDINVSFEPEEKIIVESANTAINVYNLPQSLVTIVQPEGTKLWLSFPAEITTGVQGAGGDLFLYDFVLPERMKIGDHIRLVHYGSIGDNSTPPAWWFKVWIAGALASSIVINPTSNVSPNRQVYSQEIDLLFDTLNLCWIQHWFSMSDSRVDAELAAAGSGAEGSHGSVGTYVRVPEKLAGLSVSLTVQNGSAPTGSVRARGLTVEHLIAP